MPVGMGSLRTDPILLDSDRLRHLLRVDSQQHFRAWTHRIDPFFAGPPATNYPADVGLSNDSAGSVFVSSDGTVWVGAYGGKTKPRKMSLADLKHPQLCQLFVEKSPMYSEPPSGVRLVVMGCLQRLLNEMAFPPCNRLVKRHC